MLINELPDDCLLTIFDYLDYLGDLINCYKVCIKWSHLILKRTKKVKYFTQNYLQMDHRVYYRDYRGEEPIDGTCLSKLFSNLKFAEINYKLYEKVEYKDIVALVRNQKSLEGLRACSSFKHPDKPEIVSFDLLEPSMQHNMKQLSGVYDLASFQRDAHYFPNLERLNIICKSQYYDGPVLEKLKIIELCLQSCGGLFIVYSFQFMDSCPNLQSAHITVNHRFFVDETIKLQYLQDLVIHFNSRCDNSWNDFERLFMKYPNLKHLSLRGVPIITDEHIEQLVHILPNLVLLDVRNCNGVTQRAADYVQSHCKRYGRSIKFYFNGDDDYNQIASEWPQLSTEWEGISRGFDFMKHCFLKPFICLSAFLIPIDY